MGLKEVFSYYGRLKGETPARSLADDLINERKQVMMQEMKEMEDRLKRHLNECKREIIREIEVVFNIIKLTKKENANAKQRASKRIDG